MRIYEYLLGFFDESEKELKSELDRAQTRIDDLKEKLDHTSEKGKIASLFSQTPEDLKAELAEARAARDDLRKRLEKLKKREKARRKTARRMEKKQQAFFAWLIDNKYKVGFFLLLLVIVGFILSRVYIDSQTYSFECSDKNPCTDCLAVASCLDIQEEGPNSFAWFNVENRHDLSGRCYAIFDIGGKIQNNTLGMISPGEEKTFHFPVDIPYGESDIVLDIECDWQ